MWRPIRPSGRPTGPEEWGPTAPIDSVQGTALYARVPYGVNGPVSISVTAGDTTVQAAERFAVTTGGTESFAVAGTTLEGVEFSDADWGEVDGDGDLDLVETDSETGTLIFEHRGTAQLSLVDSFEDGLSRGALEWADADGEGTLDVLGTGSDANNALKAILYENQGSGAPNDRPTATADTFSTPANRALAVSAPGVLGNDTDPDGDSLAASLVSRVSNGTLTLNAEGSFSYNPDSDFAGTDSFTYEVTDPEGRSDQATATIEVVEGDSVTVQVDDISAASGDTLSVPIQIGNLNETAGVLSYGFELGFDESVLSYVGFEKEGTLSEVAGFTVNENPDIPRIGGFGSTPLNEVTEDGSGTMLRVNLAVTAQDSATVTIDSLQFNAGEVPADPPQPSFLVDATILPGDVNEDGQVTPFDASLALQFFLDLIDLTPSQQQAADLNGDDTVTPFDASLILQEFLGIRSSASLASAQTAQATGDKRGASKALVQLGEPRVDGDRATVPVFLSDQAEDVQSVALTLRPSSEAVSVTEVVPKVPEGWIAEQAVQEDGTVEVGIAGARATGGRRQIATVKMDLAQSGAPVELEGHAQVNAGPEVQLGSERPSRAALEKVYPNPASGRATVAYAVPEPADVTIAVYDVLGRRVATLADGSMEAGRHTARLGAGQLSSGTYFVRMRADDFQQTRRLTVVR